MSILHLVDNDGIVLLTDRRVNARPLGAKYANDVRPRPRHMADRQCLLVKLHGKWDA